MPDCVPSTGEARLAVVYEDFQDSAHLDRRHWREAEVYTKIEKHAWDFAIEKGGEYVSIKWPSRMSTQGAIRAAALV
jgi:hypothetical protein